MKTVTGRTTPSWGAIDEAGDLKPVEAMPPADWVEIVEEGNGYFLFRYTEDGQFAGDSWFASVDEAKRQALFEYGIGAHDWPDEGA